MANVSDLILKVPLAERDAFKNKVTQIANRLGVPFNHLMAIMDLESAGTFNPAIKNSLGYVGLIQFGAAAAKDLGTTTEALQKMTRLQQLDYVEKYFNMWKSKLKISKFNDFVDLYLVVLYPAAVSIKDPNAPLMPQKVADANPGLKDSNGNVTRNSIKAVYSRRYQGLFDQLVDYGRRNPAIVILGLIGTTVLIFLAYQYLYLPQPSVSLTQTITPLKKGFSGT